jgi:hypothetical protein
MCLQRSALRVIKPGTGIALGLKEGNMKKFSVGLVLACALALLVGRPASAQVVTLQQIWNKLVQVGDAVARVESLLKGPATQKLSSGVFGLPAGAQSVDWILVNDSPSSQSVKVTVYQINIGSPKTVLAPGTLTVNVGAGASTHNANSVGSVFQVGGHYEVVVETAHANVLPSVNIWSNNGGTVIAGTLIPPGVWVELR